MNLTPASSPEERAIPPKPVPTYAEQLAELKAPRRAADDVVLRKMLHPREPINPGNRAPLFTAFGHSPALVGLES
mgnify:CR=1 FL=1